MITKSKAFVTGDGQIFGTMAEAQEAELSTLIKGVHPDEKLDAESLAEQLVIKKDEVLAILHTRKPRTPKAKTLKKAKPQVVSVEAA